LLQKQREQKIIEHEAITKEKEEKLLRTKENNDALLLQKRRVNILYRHMRKNKEQ